MEATKRVSIPHLTKMKPIDFLDLCYYIRDNLKGVISNKTMYITEKIDGFGIRFGVDAAGRFFVESSSSGPQYEMGAFSRFNIEKRGESNKIADGYDDVLYRLAHHPALREYLTIPGGVKIIGECLYTPNAEWVGDGLRFVNAIYDPKLLGHWATFVCFGVVSPNVVDFDKMMAGLERLSSPLIKFTTPYIHFVDTDVSTYTDLVLDIQGKRDILLSRTHANREEKAALIGIIEAVQQRMSEALIAGAHSQFGGLEGLVFEIPGGKKFKVVTPEYTNARLSVSSE